MDHQHSHSNHDMHNSESIISSNDSCCSGTDTSEGSAQHMMHHMMTVS